MLNSMLNKLSIILNTLFILLCIILGYFVIWPTPIFNYISTIFPDETIYTDVQFKTLIMNDITVYIKQYSEKISSTAVVYLPGGAFIKTTPNLGVLYFMQQHNIDNQINNYDIYAIQYPNIIKSNIIDISNKIQKTFEEITKNYKTKVLLAYSAGAYFGIRIANLSDLLIIINGYFGSQFSSKHIIKLLDKLYINKAFREKLPIEPLTITTKLITSTDDFLMNDTITFAKKYNLQYSTYTGSHSFFFAPTTNEAQKAYSEVNTLIAQVVKQKNI